MNSIRANDGSSSRPIVRSLSGHADVERRGIASCHRGKALSSLVIRKDEQSSGELSVRSAHNSPGRAILALFRENFERSSKARYSLISNELAHGHQLSPKLF